MRKDYIYQDTTGKFKLMQNAARIGGFVAGDGGIVPSERVLPEQRFAHQPIFRRPPEEKVAVYSYLHNGLFPPNSSRIKVANLIRKSQTPDGVKLTYGYTGWEYSPTRKDILLKNWSYEAQQSKTVINNVCEPEAREWRTYWPGEGVKLDAYMNPVFFRDYVWFKNADDSILFSKLKKDKSETKDIRVAIREPNRQIFQICCVYRDNDSYKMIVTKETVPPSSTFVSTDVYFYTGTWFPQGGDPKFWLAFVDVTLVNTGWWRGWMITPFGLMGDPSGGITQLEFSTGCGSGNIAAPANTIGIAVKQPPSSMGNESYSINLVTYKSNSLEGPWEVDMVWSPNLYAIFWSEDEYYNNAQWRATASEIANIVSSKNNAELSLSVQGYEWGYGGLWQEILQQVYDPPFNYDKASPVWSRGKEGEIVTINDYEQWQQEISHTELRHVVVWSGPGGEVGRWEGPWFDSRYASANPTPFVWLLYCSPDYLPVKLKGFIGNNIIIDTACYNHQLGTQIFTEQRVIPDGTIQRLRVVGAEKKYLAKRLGNGEMNKSLITEVIQKE